MLLRGFFPIGLMAQPTEGAGSGTLFQWATELWHLFNFYLAPVMPILFFPSIRLISQGNASAGIFTAIDWRHKKIHWFLTLRFGLDFVFRSLFR